MRTKFAFPFFAMIVLTAVIILVEAEPGRGAPQKGKDFKWDPAMIFDKMSKGKSFFVISEIERWKGSGKEEMELFAKENGIADGKITKDLYLKYFAQREDIRAKLGVEPGGKKKKDGGNDETKKKEPLDEKAIDEEAAKTFSKYDANSDGFLNPEEIGKTMFFKAEWEKWDENKDKLISLSEWKTYYLDMKKRMADGSFFKKDSKNNKKTVVDDDDDEERIIVYRLGKLPKDIPDWFKDLDLDKDGQISLYEWNKAGKDIEEFMKMDRNDDGFLTAEEVVRFQRIVAEAQQRPTQVTSTINGSTSTTQKTDEGKDKGNFYKKKKNKFGG